MSQKAEIGNQKRFWSKRQASVLLLVVLVAEFASQASAKTSSADKHLSITVQVCIYAEVKPRILADSEFQVTEIFRAVGIHTVWTTGPTPSEPLYRNEFGRVEAPADIQLNLLTSPMVEKLLFRHEPMGFALPCSRNKKDCVAGVSYPRVEEFAAGGFAPLERVLACAVAHEIGHLLLGPNSHSALGIKRGVWERSDFAPDPRLRRTLLAPPGCHLYCFPDRRTNYLARPG